MVLLPSLHMAAVQSLTVLRRTRVKLRGAGGDDDSGEADGVGMHVHLCSGTAKACSEPCIGKVVSRNGSLFISLFSFPALCRGDHLFHGEVTLDLPSSLLAPTRGQSYLDFAPANATSACAAREHGDGRKGGQEVGGGLGGFELMSTTST
uniref:Uncharacterized protein n=1 Tax=Oryza rufipogon TaxID=4529 RepID=A0A0E0NUP4_ORYRU